MYSVIIYLPAFDSGPMNGNGAHQKESRDEKEVLVHKNGTTYIIGAL